MGWGVEVPISVGIEENRVFRRFDGSSLRARFMWSRILFEIMFLYYDFCKKI